MGKASTATSSTNLEFQSKLLQDGIDTRELSSYKPRTTSTATNQHRLQLKPPLIYHLLEFRHYACSSIQLVRFFVTLIFTYFVAYHDAFNSSPSRIGCFITKEGAS